MRLDGFYTKWQFKNVQLAENPPLFLRMIDRGERFVQSSSWKGCFPCLMPKNICKICKTQCADFRHLQSHWRAEHAHEYVKVRTWLADVEEAVIVADIVAKEGMKGGFAGREQKGDENK